MPMQATIDTLIGTLLVFLAMSIAFGDVITFAATNTRTNAGGIIAMAGTAERATLAYLADTSGPGLSEDKLLALSNVPTGTQPAAPYTSYDQFLADLNLQHIGLQMDVRPPLTVDYNITSQGLTLSITRTFSSTPISANVKVYFFDGTTVYSVLQGQASVDGKMFFGSPLPQGSMAIMFANSGTATGYNATYTDGTQMSDGPEYVQAGALVGDASVFVFAYEDWIGQSCMQVTAGEKCVPFPPSASLNLSGFSFPALLVYTSGGAFFASPYPRLPEGYGSRITSRVTTSQLIVNTNVGGSIFVMRITVWVT